MPKKNIAYAEAMAEIEAIVARIESNELDVDSLSMQIKRVSELITLCRAKLYATEEEVQRIMDGLAAER
ncbi:MAG: exodeoxyribonuclease VII small subunit [Bacteroidales bacterium]|nr:exodeoxyribonuclease VII small subunit [Bacteroidales bacterium]